METHSFGVQLAIKYGMAEAVLLGYFYYWVRRNEAKQDPEKFHDGRYWVYDSTRGLQKKFPYISYGKILRILDKLSEQGLLIKGNFNKLPWDKTVWYSLSDLALSYFDDRSDLYQNGAGVLQNGATIPIQSTYSIPYSNDDDDNIKQTKKKKKVNQKAALSFENPIHSKAVDDWEKYMGIPLTSGLAEQIIGLVDEVGGDIFLEALKVASANNVRRLKYVETVAVNMMRGDDYGSNQRSNQSGEKPAGKKPGRKKAIKGDSVPKLGDYI